MSILPLEGIRVVSFGQAAAAPAAATNLGKYGAEVLKVESMSRPDMLRYIRPFNPQLPPEQLIDDGSLFHEHNQCAKSFLANLKSPEAIEILKKLIQKSDVVLDNFSPRVMPGLGLGYKDLKKIKPDIIMASMSAVGSTGPMSHMLAYAPTVGAMCGNDSMMGYPDGGKAIDYFAGDYWCGMTTAMLIMAAIRYRNRTGKGQFIDLGEVEPAIYMLGEPAMDYAMNNRVAGKRGNWRDGFCPSNNYPTKGNDEWISIVVKTEDEWLRLCDAMGNPSWTKQDKFADRAKRIQNQAELDILIGDWTRSMFKYEAMYLLQETGVAAMPVLHEGDWPVDPHFTAREVLSFVDLPTIKNTRPIGLPVKLSETPGRIERGPLIGEHNDYVYGEILGLSGDEIEKLKTAKVIA